MSSVINLTTIKKFFDKIAGCSYTSDQLMDMFKKDIAKPKNTRPNPKFTQTTLIGSSVCIQKFKSGKKKFQVNYESGKATGKFIEWEENGWIKFEGYMNKKKKQKVFFKIQEYSVDRISLIALKSIMSKQIKNVSSRFKYCSVCKKTWETREQFLYDVDIQLVGYQPNFIVLKEGFFLF